MVINSADTETSRLVGPKINKEKAKKDLQRSLGIRFTC